MARIALAGLQHETNTFAPTRTDYESFASGGGALARVVTGDELIRLRGTRMNSASSGFWNAAEARGHTLEPLVGAGASRFRHFVSAGHVHLTRWLAPRVKQTSLSLYMPISINDNDCLLSKSGSSPA